MARIHTLIAAAAVLAGAMTGVASAATCSTAHSFFGTIERVTGNRVTVSTTGNRWAVVQLGPRTTVNQNGNTLRQGTYLGAYGCVEPSGVFDAYEVTLSASATTYNKTDSGIIKRITPGHLTVSTNGHWGTWVVPNSDDFQVGQTVTGTGFIAASGMFYPTRINGRSIAYDPDTTRPPSAPPITLSGTVVRISGNRMYVREPANNTTGVWIWNSANLFHVGQHVTATGTEDRAGHFYPSHVSTP